LPLEPLDRHVHYSETARSVRGSVPIRSTARDEAEEVSERQQPLDVFRRVAGVPYLQPVEPRRDQRLQPFAPAAVGRMRPDRQRAGLVSNGDRVLDRKTLPGDKRAPRGSEISRERLPKIVHKAAPDQRTGNVRTSNRTAIGLQKNLVQRERNAKGIEFIHDLLGPCVAPGAQPGETRLQPRYMRDVQRQQMDLVVFLESAQLHSGDYSNTEALTGYARRRDSINGVVIRERQGCKATALGGLDYSFWCEGAVRGGRVSVQVDECRPARIRTHRS